MKLPDFVKSKAFWEAVSLVVGGVLALLAFFGKIDPSWAVPSTVVLAWIIAFLRMFGINPEIRLKAMQARYELLLEENAQLRKTLLSRPVEAKTVYKKNRR